MYKVNTRERYDLSLVCTSRKVDVQEGGGLRSRKQTENRCVSFIHLMFSTIVVIWP
jgi:hypothetical protein